MCRSPASRSVFPRVVSLLPASFSSAAVCLKIVAAKKPASAGPRAAVWYLGICNSVCTLIKADKHSLAQPVSVRNTTHTRPSDLFSAPRCGGSSYRSIPSLRPKKTGHFVFLLRKRRREKELHPACPWALHRQPIHCIPSSWVVHMAVHCFPFSALSCEKHMGTEENKKTRWQPKEGVDDGWRAPGERSSSRRRPWTGEPKSKAPPLRPQVVRAPSFASLGGVVVGLFLVSADR